MKIGICGHGQHGKDTVAEWLGRNTSLRYEAGTSLYAADEVFAWLKARRQYATAYADATECWLDRYQHRQDWAEAIGDFNREDPIRLYRACLDNQDLLTGVRWRHEFAACRAASLVDFWVWVSRPGHPLDPTCQVREADCDLSICNGGDIPDLYHKLTRVCSALGILAVAA